MLIIDVTMNHVALPYARPDIAKVCFCGETAFGLCRTVFTSCCKLADKGDKHVPMRHLFFCGEKNGKMVWAFQYYV